MGNYKKPQPTEITTTELCDYGCNQLAKYEFMNGKKCCSKNYNSCPKKRKDFSNLDHSERTAKSLETRTRLGITKTSQVKAAKTRKKQGHYEKLATKMREHWANNPWENNPRCPLIPYKDMDLKYQGSFEYEFLEELEEKFGLEWVEKNVRRGPSIWYRDPETNEKRLYISDFIIDNTIYEIKSHWSWNKKDTDLGLERLNKAKLQQCIAEGYNVKLILDGKEFIWQ